MDDVDKLVEKLVEKLESYNAWSTFHNYHNQLMAEAAAALTASRAEVAEAQDAMQAVRAACREAMGGNTSFLDDDVARAVTTLNAQLAEARRVIALAEDELRLINMKDTGALYHIGLRSDLRAFLSRTQDPAEPVGTAASANVPASSRDADTTLQGAGGPGAPALIESMCTLDDDPEIRVTSYTVRLDDVAARDDRIRREAYERAAKACAKMRRPEPQDNEEQVHNAAIDDCINAIRALADAEKEARDEDV